MSVARAAGAVIRPTKRAGTTLLQQRAASTHAHDEHHHEEYHDTNVYEPEVFNTPFWRRAAIAGLGVVAFYKFAPAPEEDNAITRFISKTMSSGDEWKAKASKHLAQSAQDADETLLTMDAKPPVIHRFRYPQRFEQYSPHLLPVGIKVDVGDVVVKRD